MVVSSRSRTRRAATALPRETERAEHRAHAPARVPGVTGSNPAWSGSGSGFVRFVSSRGARALGEINLAFAYGRGAHERLRLGGRGDVLADFRRGGPLRLRALSFAVSLARGDDGGGFVIEGARRGSGGGGDGDASLLERGVFGSRAAQADVSVGVGGVGGVGGSAEARRDGERAADVAGAVFGEPGGETRGEVDVLGAERRGGRAGGSRGIVVVVGVRLALLGSLGGHARELRVQGVLVDVIAELGDASRLGEDRGLRRFGGVGEGWSGGNDAGAVCVSPGGRGGRTLPLPDIALRVGQSNASRLACRARPRRTREKMDPYAPRACGARLP